MTEGYVNGSGWRDWAENGDGASAVENKKRGRASMPAWRAQKRAPLGGPIPIKGLGGIGQWGTAAIATVVLWWVRVGGLSRKG